MHNPPLGAGPRRHQFELEFLRSHATLEAMKAAVMTLGCRSNQADSAGLSEILRRAGYQIVPWHEIADLYLINT